MSQENPDNPEALAAALDDCEERVDQLKRENTLLREASRTFGALAERLNASLELERRRGDERRAVPRGSGERRTASAVADRSDH